MKSASLCFLLIGCLGLWIEPGWVEASTQKADVLGPSLMVGQSQPTAPRVVSGKRSAGKSRSQSGQSSWDRSYSMPPLSGERHLSLGQEYDDPLYVGYQLGHTLEQEYGPYLSLFIAAGVGAVREASQDSTVRTDMIGAFLGTYGRRLLPEQDRGLNLSIRSTPIGTAFGFSIKFR